MIKPLKAFLGFCLGLVIIPFYLLLLIVALIAGVLLFAACVLLKSEIAEMEKHIARLRAFDEKIVKV